MLQHSDDLVETILSADAEASGADRLMDALRGLTTLVESFEVVDWEMAKERTVVPGEPISAPDGSRWRQHTPGDLHVNLRMTLRRSS